MARYGRTIPPRHIVIKSRPPAVSATVNLPALQMPWSVHLPTVTASGSIAIPAPTVPLTWDVHAPQVHTSQTVHLEAVGWTWLVQPPDVEVPPLPGDRITRPGQIEWAGFLMGAGTPYRWLELQGWEDLPGIDSGNVPQASRHGSHAGRALAQERIILWTGLIRAPRDSFEQAVQDLRRVTGIPDDEGERPLVIRVLDTPYLVWAQIRQRSVTIDKRFRLGHARAAIQWVCPDPRLYGLIARGRTVPVSTTPTELVNAGNAATHPTIRVAGPAAGITLTNHTLGRRLELDIDVAEGEILEINTGAGTISIGDTPHLSALTGSSVPVPDFVLTSGVNEITFEAESGGAEGADFLWRDAWL